jgi:CxxC-x17-CxxC domain-containing protein
MSALPRGMVFIDYPNITSGGGAYGNIRLNFPGLISVLTRDTRHVGLNAYVADRGSRQELFREMNRSGLKAEPISPGKSVDGRLIFDMIVGAQRDFYDVCILASGDRDYVPVVQEIKRLKKQVWIASFSNSIAPSLRACADKFIDLDQYIKDVLLTRKLYPANCSDCGAPFQLPFQPISGKSFYCRKCLPKHRGMQS